MTKILEREQARHVHDVLAHSAGLGGLFYGDVGHIEPRPDDEGKDMLMLLSAAFAKGDPRLRVAVLAAGLSFNHLAMVASLTAAIGEDRKAPTGAPTGAVDRWMTAAGSSGVLDDGRGFGDVGSIQAVAGIRPALDALLRPASLNARDVQAELQPVLFAPRARLLHAAAAGLTTGVDYGVTVLEILTDMQGGDLLALARLWHALAYHGALSDHTLREWLAVDPLSLLHIN